MGVVEESVEDGVSEGGVADDIVPVLDGELGGEDGAAAGVAVVEDFEQIVAALARQGGEAPVVEDEEPGLGQPLNELGIRTVPAGEGELVEEAGDAEVAGRDAEAARLVAESAGQVGLAGPGRPGDQHGLAVLDPLSGGEAEDEGAVEAAGRLEVEVFDRRVEVELGESLEAQVAALGSFGPLAFEEQRQAVLEGEFADVGHGELLLEGLGHAGQAQFVEQIEGGLAKHLRQVSLPLSELA